MVNFIGHFPITRYLMIHYFFRYKIIFLPMNENTIIERPFYVCELVFNKPLSSPNFLKPFLDMFNLKFGFVCVNARPTYMYITLSHGRFPHQSGHFDQTYGFYVRFFCFHIAEFLKHGQSLVNWHCAWHSIFHSVSIISIDP